MIISTQHIVMQNQREDTLQFDFDMYLDSDLLLGEY